MDTRSVPRPPLDRRRPSTSRPPGPSRAAATRRGTRSTRPRSRVRPALAGGFVALLLVACLVALRDRSPGGASAAAPSAPSATTATNATASRAPSARPPASRPTTTTASRPDPADPAAAALRSLVDAPASCTTRGRGTAVTLACPIEGGVVEYRRPAAPGDEYRRAIGPAEPVAASGPAACASGHEEERAWSRPDAPTVTAGRYACRFVEGRAELWWTENATALVAHATRGDGDLAALFAWWRAGASVTDGG